MVALGEGSVDSLFHLVLLVLEKPVHCWLFSRINKVHVFSQWLRINSVNLILIGGILKHLL